MSYVNVSEVGTFQEALSYCGHKNIKIPHIADLTRREIADRTYMVPTETLGKLWNATSAILPVEYALQVAEAHTETTKVYGQWGELMDLAADIRDRLITGISLMPAHTDDPKWELENDKGLFHLIRNWKYSNTSPRAEAFAAISEFREWLIVMQRHISIPVQPIGIEFKNNLYNSLAPDELKHIARFFGCNICLSSKNAIVFPSSTLGYGSDNGDPEKLSSLKSRLLGKLSQNTISISKPIGQVHIDTWLKSKNKELDVSKFLTCLDERHREALSLATNDGANYIAELGHSSNVLNGIDIGGGFLEVTDIFLRKLMAKNQAHIKLTVIDPELSHPPSHLYKRKERLEHELDVAIELKPVRWLEFAESFKTDSKFDFAVAFQLLSLLPTNELEHTLITLRNCLKPCGRFFAAFEPYDMATLKQYNKLTFYQRPIEWYREVARRAGFIPHATTIHTAHNGNPLSAMVCFRFA